MVCRLMNTADELVNTPTSSLNRADPANSYNAIYLQHVFATIDAFKIFSNTLGFFSGNEVINDVNTTGVPPPKPSPRPVTTSPFPPFSCSLSFAPSLSLSLLFEF
jgi:Glucanosyltransferase